MQNDWQHGHLITAQLQPVFSFSWAGVESQKKFSTLLLLRHAKSLQIFQSLAKTQLKASRKYDKNIILYFIAIEFCSRRCHRSDPLLLHSRSLQPNTIFHMNALQTFALLSPPRGELKNFHLSLKKSSREMSERKIIFNYPHYDTQLGVYEGSG
jgi:hypothetical protein